MGEILSLDDYRTDPAEVLARYEELSRTLPIGSDSVVIVELAIEFAITEDEAPKMINAKGAST